jgi:ATP-binding cassette subfamily B multidrug efflux pump
MAYRREEAALEATSDVRMVRRLLSYLRPYKSYVFASAVLTVCNAPLALAGPPLTKVAVDLYFAPDNTRPVTGLALQIQHGAASVGLGGSRVQGILFISIVFFLANVAALLVIYVQGVLLQKVGQYIMRDMREEMFAHLERLPITFFDRNPVGRLVSRLTTDVEGLNEMFTSGVVVVFGDIAVALYVIVYMFQVNWRLALITFLILPPLMVLVRWFRKGTRAAFREIRVRIAEVNAFLQERLSSMSVVQLFDAEQREFEKFRNINEAHRSANVNTVFYYAFFYPAVQVIAAAGVALVIWYGGGQVIAGVTTIGTLIAFIQLTRSFYEPVFEISEKYNIVQSAIASSERIFAVLDEPSANPNQITALPLQGARGHIEFRNVWFAYEDEDWVLRDVSFTVEPGERVALVGNTGAGKTTIASLLLRFYEIQRGQILIDGLDIRDVKVEDLRSNFSIALQDVFLFSGTIESNIRLSNSGISDERVRAAVREVRADKFIAKLPEGLATEVNERGAGLSFGQKQLICFARALAFDPRVLILDEATSSVDTETETLIGDALERIMVERTSLVIAHRLSTIRSVDKIVVLHKGEVREIGTHQALLASRGLYWNLHRLHFGKSDEGHPQTDELEPFALV